VGNFPDNGDTVISAPLDQQRASEMSDPLPGNYLLVGGGSGIGKSLAEKLCTSTGVNATITTRQSYEDSASNVKHFVTIGGVDVMENGSVELVLKQLDKSTPLDVVIYNAGKLYINPFGENWKEEQMREVFEVNVFGAVRFANALIPYMRKGSKFVFISSMNGLPKLVCSPGDVIEPEYYMSKAALNMAGKILAETLRPKGISVHLIHPGVVITNILDVFIPKDSEKRPKPGDDLPPNLHPLLAAQRRWISADESAQKILEHVNGFDMATTGLFLDAVTGSFIDL